MVELPPYLVDLAQCYIAAPECSDEELYLERALAQACERFGLEPDWILADSRCSPTQGYIDDARREAVARG